MHQLCIWLLLLVLPLHLCQVVERTCVSCVGIEAVPCPDGGSKEGDGGRGKQDIEEVEACRKYTYNGGKPKRYQYKNNVPFDIIITDIDAKDGQKIEIGNFFCKTNVTEHGCHKYILDKRMDTPSALPKLNNHPFYIKGPKGATLKFVTSEKGSNCCAPCEKGTTWRDRRIIGGMPTGGPIDFIVRLNSIYKFNNHEISYTCTGTLIEPNWVLTAAHCIEKQDSDNPLYFLDRVEVYIGAYDISKIEPDRKNCTAGKDKVYTHDLYDKKILKYDVGLIKISDKPDDEKVKDLTKIDWHKADGDLIACVVTAAGWGIHERDNNETSDVLRKLKDVKFQPYAVCDESGKHSLVSNICAEDDDPNKGICGGDSGGPTFCKQQSGKEIQLAVLSAGIKDNSVSECDTEEEAYYIIFTKKVSEWIEKIITNK